MDRYYRCQWIQMFILNIQPVHLFSRNVAVCFNRVLGLLSVILPQGNFKGSAGWSGGVQPGRRAAWAISSETTAEHVRNYASVHALQGGSGEHGQRGKDRENTHPHLTHRSINLSSQKRNQGTRSLFWERHSQYETTVTPNHLIMSLPKLDVTWYKVTW